VILADTRIWIDYFRGPHAKMRRLLEDGQIAMHPFVLAEIALGSLHNRRKTLAEMGALWEVHVARLTEVRRMIESHALYSRGIGLIDAHLIASCLITPGTELWTRDTSLQKVARLLGIHANLS
jgi:predicted nucleic acid-binding protein